VAKPLLMDGALAILGAALPRPVVVVVNATCEPDAAHACRGVRASMFKLDSDMW